jgi:hypothetical protein
VSVIRNSNTANATGTAIKASKEYLAGANITTNPTATLRFDAIKHLAMCCCRWSVALQAALLCSKNPIDVNAWPVQHKHHAL